MPRINDRLAGPEKYSQVGSVGQTLPGNPSFIPTSAINSFMSSSGNSVPMRGVLPIEHMTDTDLYRFFPYSAYNDRMWSYTYFALRNSGRS